jgi:two-component system cell cycle sensor histidine kinase/response regulator CckA
MTQKRAAGVRTVHDTRMRVRNGATRSPELHEMAGPGIAGPRRRHSRGDVLGMFPRRAAPTVAADEGAAGESRESILLVEDEPAVRQLFATALTRAGYRVFEARNGQEALKVFDEHGDAIDLLLTDMRMPYMGGGELAQVLRSRRKTLKLICISGYPGAVESELTEDFLAKPFSREDLLAKVREVLDR